MGIFSDNAEKYWRAGLPAIPLITKQKRPAIAGWPIYAESMPTADVQEAWLRTFPDGNIGLPLGKQSGMIAIDIDTDDPKVMRILDLLLPPTPWVRIGKKGSVRMYRYAGEETWRIRGIVECLSKGTQVVLPPSIHPDTGRPYESNADLVEVVRSLPALPIGIGEMIFAALKDEGLVEGVLKGKNLEGVAKFIPSGQRDNSMIAFAGVLARAVIKGERSLMECLAEMREWANRYVENVVGDPLDLDKGYKKIVEFVMRDVTVGGKALPIGWDDDLTDELRESLGLDEAEKHRRWSSKEMIEFLTNNIIEAEGDEDQIMNAVSTILRKIAGDEEGLTALEEDRIFKFIVSQGNGMFTMTSLRRQVKELKTKDVIGESHDEIAEAVLNYINQFGELRHHAGIFWQWKGSHWEQKPEFEITKTVSSEFGNLPLCKRQSDYASIVKLLRSVAEKPLRQVDLRGINFANGFLDEYGELKRHHEDFGQTYVLDYRYMEQDAGKMPMFLTYLTHSWSADVDFEDKIRALQEAIGATLFGVAPKFQRAFCLYGVAGSGKSVMSQIVRGLMPKSAVSSVMPEKWDDTFLPAEMFGSLLNFAGELSERRPIPGQIFKQIVEGDTITAQRKNQQPFQFAPYCAQWFNSNFIPKSTDTSDGFNRRWLFLEWSRPVPDDKKIVGLDQIILSTEREAIAAWAVIGFKRLLAQREYTLPVSHLAIQDQMAVSNNSVRYFLQASPLVQIGQGGEETCHDLYNQYWNFCLNWGLSKRVSANTFMTMIRDLQNTFGFTSKMTRTNLGHQVMMIENVRILE